MLGAATKAATNKMAAVTYFKLHSKDLCVVVVTATKATFFNHVCFLIMSAQSCLCWPARSLARQKPHLAHPLSKNTWQVPGKVLTVTMAPIGIISRTPDLGILPPFL